LAQVLCTGVQASESGTHISIMAAKLNVQVAATASAEHVVLCGSHEAIGNWIPERGVELEWRHNAWVTKEPISLPRSHVEFKFVRLSERGHVEWESGDNRVLELPKTSVKGKAMHLRSKFNGSCVVSPEVVPNREALAAERAAVQAVTDAAMARQAVKRNHQQRIEQARETFRRKMEDRAKIINELQQGLEAARREMAELAQEEAQLVREVEEAESCKLHTLARSFMEVSSSGGESEEKETWGVTDISDDLSHESLHLDSSGSVASRTSSPPKDAQPLNHKDLLQLKETLYSALGSFNTTSWDEVTDVSTTCSSFDSSQARSNRARQDDRLTPTTLRKMPFRGGNSGHKAGAFSRGNPTAPLSSLSNVMKAPKPEPPANEAVQAAEDLKKGDDATAEDSSSTINMEATKESVREKLAKAAEVFLEGWQLDLDGPSQGAAGAPAERQSQERVKRTLSRCAEAPTASSAPEPVVFDIAGSQLETPEVKVGEEIPETASGKIGSAASQLLSALQPASETYERAMGA